MGCTSDNTTCLAKEEEQDQCMDPSINFQQHHHHCHRCAANSYFLWEVQKWLAEPFKSALAHAPAASLKGLDPQEAAGDIIILGGTLGRHIKEVKAALQEMGGVDYLYLKDVKRGCGVDASVKQ